MTDRELLELAAKAAGIDVYESTDGTMQNRPVWVFAAGGEMGTMPYEELWNPLQYDAQALRLAVKLGLDFYEGDDDGRAAYVGYYERRGNTKPPRFMIERHDAHADPYAATRRAIVRAAATIGASK